MRDSDESFNRSGTYFKLWLETNFQILYIKRFITITLICVMIWLIFYSIFGDFFSVNSDAFSLIVLFGTSKALSIIVEMFYIPNIIGMIAMGVILKNIGFVNLERNYISITGYLRKLTLLCILIPAAFSLEPAVLRNKWFVIFILAVIPSLFEIFGVCVTSHLLLNLPWAWSSLLGIIIAASAPAVVIPCLYILDDKGYGNVNGIHTLIIACCILDVIESLTLFGLLFGFLTTETDDIASQLSKQPIEILVGICYGIVMGLIFQYIPDKIDFYVVPLRDILIAVGSLLGLFGSHAIGYGGAGVLGCFFLTFTANIEWRKSYFIENPMREHFKIAWKFMEPISYSLIGIEIDFKELVLVDMLYGVICMFVGSVMHFVTSLTLTKMFDFTLKENIFIALTFFPKATVQAAIGPLPLDYARTVNNPLLIKYARRILAVTIVAILITSSLGMILLLKCGPKCLQKGTGTSRDRLNQESLGLVTEPGYMRRSRINNLHY